MTRSPSVIGFELATSRAAAHTYRTSTGRIVPSPMSCAGSAFAGRAHEPGSGILKSPVTSCMSDSSSSCSDAESGSPSVAWRAFSSQKRTRKPSLSITRPPSPWMHAASFLLDGVGDHNIPVRHAEHSCGHRRGAQSDSKSDEGAALVPWLGSGLYASGRRRNCAARGRAKHPRSARDGPACGRAGAGTKTAVRAANTLAATRSEMLPRHRKDHDCGAIHAAAWIGGARLAWRDVKKRQKRAEGARDRRAAGQ